MAKSACTLVLVLLVAAVSAERVPARDSSSSSSTYRDYQFERAGASSGRGSSPAASGRGSPNRWGDSDDAAENDFSTPKITAWTDKTVPYEIASDISAANQRALKAMFQDISDKTCVSFVPKRAFHNNYVSIKSGSKCSAPLGMATSARSSFSSSSSGGAVSNVILGQSCFTTKRVGRRVMNLLGIPHETSRPDRDTYVEINDKNLRPGYAANIKQIAASAYLKGVLDVPYDLQSITQYSDDDLAKNEGTWAIRAKARRTATLGGETFSQADFEKINKAYNCASSRSGSPSRSSGRSGF